MKKWLKTTAAVSLTTTLILSACGKTEDNKPADGTASPSNTPAATATTPVKEKLALTWTTYSTDANAVLPSADKDFVKKKIEEKFNVTLKLEYGAAGPDFQNKLNLKMSSGDALDLFHSDGAGSNKYMLDKAVVDLAKYINPQTMPNYYKWVTKEELKRYQMQGGDFFLRAPIIWPKQQFQAYYARKDWLDKLGLKVPTNYDELINVMKAFTFNDPDGNGKNDTYGFTTAGNGTAVSRSFPEWFKYGFGAGFYIDENNNFIDTGSNLRTGQILDDIRKTVDMKIVDPDWFLNKAGQDLDKVYQGKVGIFYSAARDAGFDNAVNSVKKKTKDLLKDDKIDFVPFHIAGNTPVSYEALPGTPFMIGAKTPENKIVRTLEIMDWLASEEGFLLTHYGQEGVHYKKEGNKITLIPDAYKKDIVDNGNFLSIYSSIMAPGIIDLSPIGLERIDPNETDHDRKILDSFKSNKYYLLGTNVAPPPGLDIGSFRTEQNKLHVKLMFDDKNATNWPKYHEELMVKYKGKEIFGAYGEQVTAVLNKKVVFKAD
ncbi:MAG: transporter substrate-binding protein [Paenibacillus sp.]|nr:transporter substrate-binding protein [Paenibacillus sp.]